MHLLKVYVIIGLISVLIRIIIFRKELSNHINIGMSIPKNGIQMFLMAIFTTVVLAGSCIFTCLLWPVNFIRLLRNIRIEL